jgi:penicillin-binding protein 2
VVGPEWSVVCRGGLRFGKRVFHCDEVHLKVDMHFALAESCDVYYYELGQMLGLDRMARVAEDLGFGAPTGLGLNSEVPGLVPSMAFYKTVPSGFQKGFVLNTSIGQGDTKVTVMQVAMAYAAIANGGKLWVPQIVEKVQTASGAVVQEFAPRLRRQLAASPEMLGQIRSALYDTVNHPKGTAWSVRVPGLDVAGKTGTAQTKKNHKGQFEEGDENNDHAWFASYAPAKAPKIAVAVMIEHGGFGAKAAAPVAMEIYQGYFDLLKKEQEQAATGLSEPKRQARRSP